MSKHPRPSTFARFGKGLTSRLQNQKTVRRLEDDALGGKARVLQGLSVGAESPPALVLLAGLNPVARIREGVQ